MQRKRLKAKITQRDKEKFEHLKKQIKEQVEELHQHGYDTTGFKIPRFTKDSTQAVERAKTRLEQITGYVQDIKNRQDNEQENDSVYNDWWYAISNFRSELTQSYAVNFPFVNYLIKWSSDIISEFGEKAFGNMLINGQDNGYILTREVMYNENNAGTDYMNGMLNFLAKDEPLKKQQLYEYWEQSEDTGWVDILRNLDY